LLVVTAAARANAATVTAPDLAATHRPVVLELFTSEGCSSCPPADRLLHELALSHADVLPLAFHVTYWDYLGWRDPFALPVATDRQRHYAAALPGGTLYTPQLVIDGTREAVGSDRGEVAAGIALAQADARQEVTLMLRRSADGVTIDIGAGDGSGTVYLVSYDAEHRTAVGRGENGGKTLLEANIVRSFVPVLQWRGAAMRVDQARPVGEHLAAFVQTADGRILAAIREDDQQKPGAAPAAGIKTPNGGGS
jgi:hypothetical protein